MTYLHQFFVFFGQMLKTTREHCKKLMQVSIDSTKQSEIEGNYEMAVEATKDFDAQK
jgi:hypothetical protein